MQDLISVKDSTGENIINACQMHNSYFGFEKIRVIIVVPEKIIKSLASTAHHQVSLKDRRRRPEGSEWESIKILLENLDYIPNSSRNIWWVSSGDYRGRTIYTSNSRALWTGNSRVIPGIHLHQTTLKSTKNPHKKMNHKSTVSCCSHMWSTEPPSVGFVAQPINRSPLGFEPQTNKPSRWFWGPNHQTRAANFEAQTGKPSTTLVLWLNQETRAPSLHVPGADRTRRHPTSRPPGYRVPDLCDHPRSSAPGLLFLSRSSSLYDMPHLPPAHHETSKRDSLNETKIKEK
jgi:hypothetical protein